MNLMQNIKMTPAKILVLDADSSAGLASTQTLGKAGKEIHVAVRSRGALIESSRWAHFIHEQPSSLPLDRAVSWLKELDALHEFQLIIPSTESSLLWIRAISEGSALRKKSVVSSNASIDTALNKEKVYLLAESLGIPVPESRLHVRGSEASGAPSTFPSVLKPVESKMALDGRLESFSVFIARDVGERESFLLKHLPYMDIQEQEWVEGRGVGVEFLYDSGNMKWHFVHHRVHEWPLTGGASSLRVAVADNPTLVEHSKRLLDSLEWHGAAMVEWRCASNGSFHFIEINPRLWGSLPLTIAAGVCIPEGLLALSQGRVLREVNTWDVGLYARNLSKDLIWTAANIKADRRDSLLLTEALLKTTFGWLRVTTGREIWDGWQLFDPLVAIHELNAAVSQICKKIQRKFWKIKTLRGAKTQSAKLMHQVQARNSRINNILFVCYGNICRSALAAAAAELALPKSIKIESAGFYSKEGRDPPLLAKKIATTLNIDLNDSKSKMLTKAHVSAADIICVMDFSNFEQLEQNFPGSGMKTIFLGAFDEIDNSVEITDPYDRPEGEFQMIFDKIIRCVGMMSLAVTQSDS